jgi:hypothetical protein
MAGAFKHEKDETVYYARRYSHVFYVPKYGEDGKQVQKTNPATGNKIFLPNGEPEYVEKMVHFKPWKTKFCADGYVCVYVVTKDTPADIVKALAKDAADRGSDVMDEKSFIATVNPELAARMAEDEANEKLLGEKDGTIKALSDEVAALKRTLSGKR